MGILGSIFGTESAVNKTVDGIYNGVDKAVFTKEEKASHFLLLLKAYEPFKLAQRLLAITVVPIYILVWLCSVTLLMIGVFADDPINLLKASEELGNRNNETLGLPVSLILGFYFGGGAVEGIISKFWEKRKT